MKIGSVVRLKSDGADMTVSNICKKYCYDTGIEFTEVTCVWHTSSFEKFQSDFDSKTLKVINL